MTTTPQLPGPSTATSAPPEELVPSVALDPLLRRRDAAVHNPHPSTLHRLKAERVRVYRTDKDGTIHVVLAGEVPSVTTSHGP